MHDFRDVHEMQARTELSMDMPSAYTAPASVDAWRHRRMLDRVDPLLQAMPNSTWMTVGDGRFGSDAAYLKAKGHSACASSLTADSLLAAQQMGRIDEFAVENAERLSRLDDSFDFVLCKEAFHHFPRPPIALYEMLRVARIAAVMIEPIDNPRVLDGVKSVVKRLLRGGSSQLFEPSGNYIYRPSIREVHKLMLAMGGKWVAHSFINDFYHARFASHEYRRGSLPTELTLLGVAVQDALCALRLMGYGLACIVVFKRAPGAELVSALRKASFLLHELPSNPYLPNSDLR